MKILIFTKNWVGDILFEFPAIEALKARYPEAEIVCVSPGRCREILEAHPAVSRVLIFDEKKEHRSFFSRIAFGLALRKEKWDQAYLFHRSRTRAFLTLLAGAKERIGFDSGRRSLFLNRSVWETESFKTLHHVDYFLKLLSGRGVPVPEKPVYRFYIPEKDRQSAETLLRENRLEQFAAFHLGANWEPKRWPPSHFAKLADLIAGKWGLDIVVTGGAGDAALFEEMKKNVKSARVVSLVGKTGLGELGAVFEKASFVVSGDSGPMHIASGAGARIVALFGPTSPAQTGPRGTGEKIILHYVPEGRTAPWYGEIKEPWLEKISPEKVLSEIEAKNWQVHLTYPQASGPARPLQILLVTLTNIGDVILNTAVIMSLVSRFPGSQITVVCGPLGRGILEGSAFVHKIIIYDKKAGWGHKLRFVREIRRQKYDMVVDLKNTLIPFLVSAKKKKFADP